MAEVQIVISGVYGGDDAGTAARGVVQEAKDRFRAAVPTRGDRDLTLAVQLYVSGEITRFDGPTGSSNIRVHLARGRVSCDVTLGVEVWSAGRARILEVLLSSLLDVVDGAARRLRAKKVDLDLAPVTDALDARVRELLADAPASRGL